MTEMEIDVLQSVNRELTKLANERAKLLETIYILLDDNTLTSGAAIEVVLKMARDYAPQKPSAVEPE